MKKLSEFVVIRLVAGLLIVAPIYLAALLLLKAMKSLAGLVTPFATLLPEWVPADQLLSLLLVLAVCFLIGLTVRTPTGRAVWERIEKSLFQRIPGYALFRSLTQRMAGEGQDTAWKPVLAEIEEALVPAFIIEELETGVSQSSSPRSPHLSRERSTSLRRIVCIRWMFLLRRRSRPFPGGDQVPRILSLQ